MLCHLHCSDACAHYGNQVPRIVQRWISRLEAFAAENDNPNPPALAGRTQTTVGVARAETERRHPGVEGHEEPRNARDGPAEPGVRRRRRQRGMSNEDDKASAQSGLQAEARRTGERREVMRNEDGEQRQRRQERELRSREQRRRDETSRERARATRERREREAREAGERGRTAWRQAWDRYSRAWEHTEALRDNITRPAYSGLQADVSEANVRRFFDEAPPEDLVRTGELRLRLINSEIMRWHNDRLMPRLGPDVVNGAARDTFALVSRLMSVLRREAQRRRRE